MLPSGLLTVAYIGASVLFILSLGGLSNQETARQVLLDFIVLSVASGHSCVRIIHGKGLRSKKEPRLKILTNRILRRHPRVAAFASCRPVDGGTGAVDVLLTVKTRSAC